MDYVIINSSVNLVKFVREQFSVKNVLDLVVFQSIGGDFYVAI
jgi:hypothetical protein